MEKFKVTFEANDQQLKSLGTKHASDTYADIEATFVLGSRWTDMDSVSAVWWNDFTRIATVLDSDGKCIVPHEVLTRKGYVRVNLVGSVVENGELVTRLTSYSAEAVKVNEKIKLTGSETSEITPSQFEQFVAEVKTDADRAEAGATESEQSAQSASESATASANSASDSAQSATASAQSAQSAQNSAISAENAKDDAEDARDKILSMRATAETLEAGSDATASYSDGLLTLGIPRGDKGVKGDTGETGATPNLSIGTVETLEPTEDATASITGTVEEPILNLGIPKGDTGEVSLEDLEALLPTETASGSIVTITDGQAVVPAKSLKVQLEPIQSGSGTPSPDNVRPISGRTEVVTQRTGVNLCDNSVMALWGVVEQDDGSWYADNNNKLYNKVLWENSHGISGSLKVIFKHRYSTSEYVGAYLRIKYTDGTIENIVGTKTTSFVEASLATNASKTVEEIVFTYSSNAVQSYVNVMVTTDLNVTSYEPYQGTTYTTTLGRTVYGGTLDVVTGELVVDRAMVDLGTLEWTWLYAWYQTTIDNMKYVSSNTEVGNGISSQYTMRKASGFSSAEVGQMAIDTANFKVKTAGEGTTPSGQLVYELATPQIIQLTPQQVQLLLGNNNVWSDGDVTLVYNADIQLWVEKQLS